MNHSRLPLALKNSLDCRQEGAPVADIEEEAVTPQKEKGPASSSQEATPTPEKGRRGSNDHWKNLRLCAYSILHAGWSAAVFTFSLAFARLAQELFQNATTVALCSRSVDVSL